MIFYLHGFSSGSQSHKAGIIKNYLKEYEIYIPNYKSHHPDNAVEYLKQYIEKRIKDKNQKSVMLMGSSLGGYYAQYLATQYDFISAVILINPCLQPEETLASQVGEQKNIVTGELFHFSISDLSAMTQYDVSEDKLFSPTLVLLDEGDDLIDYRFAARKYREKGRVVVYPGGDHWFRHMDEALPEIEAFYKLHVAR